MFSQRYREAQAVEQVAWDEWMTYVQATRLMFQEYNRLIDAGDKEEANVTHDRLMILTEKHNDAYASLQVAQTVVRKLYALETRPYFASYEI